MTNKRDEKRREKRDSTPIFMPYTCPGCDKRGSVGFTLGSLPFDFTCSACGTPSHVRREDELTVTLTFDCPPAPVSHGEVACDHPCPEYLNGEDCRCTLVNGGRSDGAAV
jgi:hypothetical protein